MEDFKQIVFRNEDEALVIVPQSENVNTTVNFLNEIDSVKAGKLNSLKNLCIEKIPVDSVLKYVVAEKGTNILNIEHSEGVISIDITTLDNIELNIVIIAINCCNDILNSI